jgi:hypothetical protein
MKSQYLYFGRKGYYSQAGVAPPGDNTAEITEIDNTNGGFVPQNLSAGDGDAKKIQVVYRVYTAGSSKRGSSYTGANAHIGVDFPDMWSDGVLDTTDTSGAAYGTPANHVQGEVTLMLDEGFTCASGVVSIKDTTASSTAGAILTTDDTVWVNETALIAGTAPLAALNSDICVPGKNLLSIVPMAADVANGLAGGHSSHDGGMHWNGDAIDVAELHFRSGDSTKAADVVQLKYTGGKFKELCRVMQHLANGNNYEEAITVHELDYNGQNVHSALTAEGIKIYGCTIVATARA